MSDEKKSSDASDAEKPAGTADPSPAPPDPDELTDAELNSVAGGFAPMHIDGYSGTNYLEA